ncbi:Glutamate receptor delta-1 subunit [Dufourea novaeangliae]|uniref:Glutamate receptor delta-1 subunit n=1 Tax=Dufourea novaeangliae TaxID=178035 RepID=A0A154PR86_DUFNO|nr:Glutamate receptor delta-1 subunit [Dufourea novaeangliae]
MSRSGVIHDIRRDSRVDFEGGLRDSTDHRLLRILDLDCDHAISLLRTANETGMFTAPNKWLLFLDRRAFGQQTPANPATGPDRSIEDEVSHIFRDANVLPDSEVFLARRLRDNFTDIYSIYKPSPTGELIFEDRGNWTTDRGLQPNNRIPVSRRRRDLRGTHLRSCLVMTDPDTINHLTDYENKHIDPITKANYPWILTMVARMNATISFRITDTWGYRDENGSWSGMTGMLQRREIDIGGTGTFFVKERLPVLDYVQLYTRTRSLFIFRQPLLSTVSNIFTLPFHRSVWLALGVFLLLVVVLLYFSSKWEYRRGTSEYWESLNPAEQTLSDNVMVVLGAMAQQGYYYEPYRVPPRIVTLMLLLAALSLYASYTANIVALLQSTSNSIKTPADLLASPLKLGAQDVIYNRYYFTQFQDPVRRAIVDQKIQPKGNKDSWMTIQEGVHRMRTELFAIHAERGTAYKIMQETFLEEEKCGITEINILNILDPLMVIQRKSPYKEIVRNAALRMHETGLKYREEYRLYTERPQCQGQTGFISIGFTECYFALVSMGYGALFSLAVFTLELLWQKKYDRREPTASMLVFDP